MDKSLKRFYWLDLFRFLAALIVVLVHARGSTFVEFGALPAEQKSLWVAVIYACTKVGNEAVIIFFVLSGFLVGGRAFERIATGSFRPLEYAIDRFTRIMLPLVPALIFTGIMGAIMRLDFNPWYFIGNLFSLQGIFVPSFGGNDPLWSLTYEVWLYILVWVVGIAILNRRLYLLSTTLLILIGAIFIHLSLVYLLCWFTGAFAYICKPEKISSGYIVGSVVVCLFAIFAVEIGIDSRSFPVESFRYLVPSGDASRLLLASGMAVLIQQVILMRPKTLFAIKLDSVGTRLASFSYTLYLTHYSVLQALSYFGLTRSPSIDSISLMFYGVKVSVCIILSLVIYWLFEMRTPGLRNWIKNTIIERPEMSLLRRMVF